MKRFVPPPYPPSWIDTDEELPDKPVDMRGFFRIDLSRPRTPLADEDMVESEEADAILELIAKEFWDKGPGTK